MDEKPHVKSWDEPQYSIHNLGIEESYGFGVLNEGQAIAVAKNVKVRQNEMSTPARPIISVGPDNANFQLPSGLVGTARKTQCFASRALLPSSYPLPENRLRRPPRPVPARPSARSAVSPEDLGLIDRAGFLGGFGIPAEFVDLLP